MVGHSASLPSIYYELLVVLGFWALFQFCLRRSSKGEARRFETEVHFTYGDSEALIGTGIVQVYAGCKWWCWDSIQDFLKQVLGLFSPPHPQPMILIMQPRLDCDRGGEEEQKLSVRGLASQLSSQE